MRICGKAVGIGDFLKPIYRLFDWMQKEEKLPLKVSNKIVVMMEMLNYKAQVETKLGS
jgi:hypothetical protein